MAVQPKIQIPSRSGHVARSFATCSKLLAPSGESKQLKKINTEHASLAKIQDEESKDLSAEIGIARPLLYTDSMKWLDNRLVRISKPTKNVMQSGTAYTNSWKIEFDSKPRGEYWLMGWTSTDDPMSNMNINFPTKESAIAYCEKNQLQWFVEEQPERKVRRKSYADNFSWNKRTRLGSK